MRKVIPDARTQDAAYARAVRIATLQAVFKDTTNKANQKRISAPIDLNEQITEKLAVQPTLSWDDAAYEIAAANTESISVGKTTRVAS